MSWHFIAPTAITAATTMRSMIFAFQSSPATPGVRRVAVSLPYAAQLIDGTKYMAIPLDMPGPKSAGDLNQRIQRPPSSGPDRLDRRKPGSSQCRVPTK